MEMVYSIVQMIDAIPRKGAISHGKMSIREIVTGKKLIILPVAIGDFIHVVPGASSSADYNSTDKLRSFEALYLRPREGRGHSVFNLNVKQVNKSVQSSHKKAVNK